MNAQLAERGVKLNAEKEKLQLNHEENELKEQLQILNDRLNHFESPNDENSVKNQTKAINGLRAELADTKGPIETLNNQLKQINDNDNDSPLIESAQKLDQLLDDKLVALENQAEYYNVVNQCRDEADWAGERRRILAGLAIPESIDDLALLRTRFDGLERDVRKREPQLALIEEKRKLLPSDIADSNTALNEASQAVYDEWRELNKLLDEKKDEFIHAEIVRKFQLDGSETELWIEEKAKVIDATRDYGDSLPGVIALQRKLATMERFGVKLKTMLLTIFCQT